MQIVLHRTLALQQDQQKKKNWFWDQISFDKISSWEFAVSVRQREALWSPPEYKHGVNAVFVCPPAMLVDSLCSEIIFLRLEEEVDMLMFCVSYMAHA